MSVVIPVCNERTTRSVCEAPAGPTRRLVEQLEDSGGYTYGALVSVPGSVSFPADLFIMIEETTESRHRGTETQS